MTADEGQQWPTTANAGQQQPSSNSGLRMPAKAGKAAARGEEGARDGKRLEPQVCFFLYPFILPY